MCIKKRIALWALGQALPNASALRPVMRAGLVAVVAAAAWGVIIAVAIIAILTVFYFYMVGEGLHSGVALGVTVGIGVLCVSLATLVISHSIEKTIHVQQSLKLFNGSAEHTIGKILNCILDGFLDGLMEHPSRSMRANAEEDEDPEK